MWQSAIVGRVGLTHATVNRIFQRHAATGTLVPGKSTGAPWKTTTHKDCFVEDGLTGLLHKCSGLNGVDEEFVWMRAGWKTINSWLLSRGYHAYRPTRKPLLIAKRHHLRLEWEQRWQNQTMAHWQYVIFGDETRFELYLVVGRLRARRLPCEHFQRRCQAYRVQAGSGSVHVWGAFDSGAKTPLSLPDRYLTRSTPHLTALG